MTQLSRSHVRRSALSHFRAREYYEAQRLFSELHRQGDTSPVVSSYLGLLAGLVEGRKQEAVQLCRRALAVGILDPELYVNLARAQMLSGRREDAVATLRRGLGHTPGHAEMTALIDRLQPRDDGLLPGLGRAHPVNRVIGRWRRRSA